MEQFLKLLPIIIAAAQQIPEMKQILPLLTQIGTTTFPGLPTDKAPEAAATTLDGNGVKWIQTALNLLQKASLDVDGVYGQGTKAAVTKFQQANNLEADGWAGTKTADALRAALMARG
jgi:peptidoglycan hydrolase-like protein with peptidoglycan-binding domain